MIFKQDIDLLKDFKWARFTIIALILWSLLAIIISFRSGVYELSQGEKVYWLHIFFFNFNSAFLWALLTPLLLQWTYLMFTKFSRWYIILLLHLLLAGILSPLVAYIFLVLDYAVQHWLQLWTSDMPFELYRASYFLELTVNGWITYAILQGLLIGYLLYLRNQQASERQAQLEEHLMQSRITNLKYQLQPHFLFNSMQTVSNLMHKDVELADQAMTDLSDILRSSIQQLDSNKIRLAEEITLTEKYLDFQKIRFNEAVSYSIVADPMLLDHKVPAFLLQPLVENSIKHGFEKTGRAVHIDIHIAAERNFIIFDVKDNGEGIPEQEWEKNSGIGLKNLRNRLAYLYPNQFQFELIPSDAGGGHVLIKIPAHDPS